MINNFTQYLVCMSLDFFQLKVVMFNKFIPYVSQGINHTVVQWRIQDFPWAGRGPLWGVDSRGSYISNILYVKTKESGHLGEACAGHASLDPPM